MGGNVLGVAFISLGDRPLLTPANCRVTTDNAAGVVDPNLYALLQVGSSNSLDDRAHLFVRPRAVNADWCSTQ